MEKNIMPKVPTKRNVYTKASIESFLNCCNEISCKFTKILCVEITPAWRFGPTQRSCVAPKGFYFFFKEPVETTCGVFFLHIFPRAEG